MSRPGRRCSLTVAAVAMALLAAPAGVQAATYAVQADAGSCGDPDFLCGTLSDAAAATASGGPDTVNVPPGTYNESPTFTGSATTISGTGSGFVVNGAMTFSGVTAGASTFEKAVVINPTGAGITIDASYNVTVRDAVVIGGGGNGITITAGNNSIIRSQVFAGASGASAVDISSAATPLTTTLESSILGAPGNGIGLQVQTNNTSVITPGSAANGTVNARHITIAGATTGMRLDASNTLNLGTAVGNITVNTSDSIVQGDISTATQPLLTPNSVTTNFLRTDRTTPSIQLFVNPGGGNFHLRPDAPVIGQGQVSGGESATDVDGDDRAAAPTDLGADEFVNRPPTAKIAVKNVPRDGQPTQFDASGSTDPEGAAGGGITQYIWDFGDGIKQATTTPTVSHIYKGEGPISAKLAVVDRQGGVSAVVSTQLTVLDGGAPAVTVTKPKARQKINIFIFKTVKKNGVKRRVRTSKRTRIKFAGAASDKSGVQSVYVTVEKVSNPSSSTVVEGAQAAPRCRWLDPKTGLKRTLCSKPIAIKAKLASNGSWTYNVRSSIKLSKGGYRVIAYGADKAGSFGNSATKSLRNISFTLK